MRLKFRFEGLILRKIIKINYPGLMLFSLYAVFPLDDIFIQQWNMKCFLPWYLGESSSVANNLYFPSNQYIKYVFFSVFILNIFNDISFFWDATLP